MIRFELYFEGRLILIIPPLYSNHFVGFLVPLLLG